MTRAIDPGIFQSLYEAFSSPITERDCGLMCGPHNQRGVPFCCDISVSIPSAYCEEWAYLQASTDLWRPWEEDSHLEGQELHRHLQSGQQLIACQGHLFCQRNYRSIACRAFPFFPYFSSQKVFLGMSYYREYRDRCWVLSHLEEVKRAYIDQFMTVFQALFDLYPRSEGEYQGFSIWVRNQALQEEDQLTLLTPHREAVLIDPQTEAMQPVNVRDLPAFGPYDIIRKMPFPGELK